MFFPPVVFQWSYSHNSSRHKSQWDNIRAPVSPMAAIPAWLTTEGRERPFLWYAQIGLLLELIQHHYFLTENVFSQNWNFCKEHFVLQMLNFSSGKNPHFVSRLVNIKIHFPFPSVPKEAQYNLESAALNLPGSFSTELRMSLTCRRLTEGCILTTDSILLCFQSMKAKHDFIKWSPEDSVLLNINYISIVLQVHKESCPAGRQTHPQLPNL